MPNQDYTRRFRESVSNERLDGYRQRGVGGGDENLLVHYAWNVALAESFYPALQCMEIALRNAVHDAATAAYGSAFWFNTPGLLAALGATEIAKSRDSLLERKKPITAAGIIAEQNFGFWTACFNREQETRLWPKISRRTFPYMPKHLRQRSFVADRLSEIRKFRNRVFHHEPIWHLRDLRAKHARILELTEWISPAMAEFATAIDRFPGLYGAGMAAFQADLERRFSRIT